MRSVGVDEDRREHTDSPVELDLEPVRQTLATEPLEQAVDDLKTRLREYTRKRGFINGGELQPLDDRYLAARELLHAADLAARNHSPTETEELYVLELLGGTERGQWPPETGIPDSLAAARGLAVAEAVEAYRRDLRGWLDDHPDPEATKTPGSLRDHRCRPRSAVASAPRAGWRGCSSSVLSSSVFTTGGANNPTLTIAALALKAADHIDDRL